MWIIQTPPYPVMHLHKNWYLMIIPNKYYPGYFEQSFLAKVKRIYNCISEPVHTFKSKSCVVEEGTWITFSGRKSRYMNILNCIQIPILYLPCAWLLSLTSSLPLCKLSHSMLISPTICLLWAWSPWICYTSLRCYTGPLTPVTPRCAWYQ